MISTIGYIALSLIALSALVFVHELGHYLIGRATGMGIVEFAIGFGPKLISWERKGVRYSLRLLPLGGFCQFYGEDEAEIDERAFNAKPAWRRFLTVLAGPVMNILTALLLVVVVLTAVGEKTILPVVAEIGEDSPAYEAGMRVGDEMVSINGQYSEDYYQLYLWLQEAIQEPVQIGVVRDGQEMQFTVQARVDEEAGVYRIGASFGMGRVHYGLFESIGISVRYSAIMLKEMFVSLGQLFVPNSEAELMGIVGTVDFMSETTQSGFESGFLDGLEILLNLAILLSLNLALINFLPFPGLDGGRLVLLAIEMIFKRALPREKEAWVHIGGTAILIVLAIFITVKDVVRLFG